jgi:PAS domain S-box-containing protein
VFSGGGGVGHRAASLRYGVAVACVAAGWALRHAFTPVFGPNELPYIFFFLSVAVAAWYGGLYPALLAIVLSTLAANWSFIAPVESLGIQRSRDLIGQIAFILTSFVIAGAIELMHRAQASLASERELFATTLASIGDAVIVTDAAGRVSFLNREAEQLTGWTGAEAGGRPLPEVFRIVNAQTRAPVENPVDKVLRLGTVVGLANHTLLVARDGREIPIDDSAAPIRRAGGPLYGVVLVFRDFTEQANARASLQRSKAELEEQVRSRTAMLQELVEELQHVSYAIAHDMRAPLRAMSVFAGLLMERASGPGVGEELREYSRRILVGASRLDRLIRDALHYTQLAAQDMALEPVDLAGLVRGLIETYPNFQPEKADIRVEGELPVVVGNEALLTQCFSNLLDNAVKFVAPGTRPSVRLRAQSEDGTARIWVQDNGIGIAKYAQPRLFRMFEKLDDRYEGTGIGLAIVRKVAERMGGRVGVESAPGEGSRFWVELPRARADA